ncbi:Cytosolic carboxypeptidase 6 [Diplonema papillatum]|nr:Cytosolic carboxypeptidase 6 [Diplonema papillatum]
MKETVNGLTFTDEFDSGNLLKVDPGGTADEYVCTARCDCQGTRYANPALSSWFYFEITGGLRGQTISIAVRNMNPQPRLYENDMRPVFKRKGTGTWQRIARRVRTTLPASPKGSSQPYDAMKKVPLSAAAAYAATTTSPATTPEYFTIRWEHTFEGEESVRFAFTYPYSLTDFDRSASLWAADAEKNGVIFERSSIGKSVENRDVTLLKITGNRGTEARKRIVLLSARVHPGETPGSYMLHGLIDFLLKSDHPSASALLDNCVFMVVPFLNPDGVSRGHYRNDTFGVNLNRMYDVPSQQRHPTIHVMKKLFVSLSSTNRLVLFLDFHAHATKRGCFMYGNAFTGEKHAETLLFPKLVSLNTDLFDFEGSSFTKKNMKAKSKTDGLSKKGTSRVALFEASGLLQCYTIEANYNGGRPTATVPSPSPYTIGDFFEVGAAVAMSVADMHGVNPEPVWASAGLSSAASVRDALLQSTCKQPVAKTGSAASMVSAAKSRDSAAGAARTAAGPAGGAPHKVRLPTLQKQADAAGRPQHAKQTKSPVTCFAEAASVSRGAKRAGAAANRDSIRRA